MSLKNNEKEKEPIVTNLDEEYDEDLEEAFGEEILEVSRKKKETIVENNNDNNLENIDKEIEKNISACLICGSVVKWLMILMAVITFIVGIASDEGVIVGLITSISFVIYGFLASIIIKWFGYVLKCLYDIKNK